MPTWRDEIAKMTPAQVRVAASAVAPHVQDRLRSLFFPGGVVKRGPRAGNFCLIQRQFFIDRESICGLRRMPPVLKGDEFFRAPRPVVNWSARSNCTFQCGTFTYL